PTSLPLLSRSAALADWAAAGKATAAVSSAAAPTVPTHFKIVMTQLLGVAPGTAGLDADCGILQWKIARGTSVPARVKTWLALEGGSDIPRQAMRRSRGRRAAPRCSGAGPADRLSLASSYHAAVRKCSTSWRA